MKRPKDDDAIEIVDLGAPEQTEDGMLVQEMPDGSLVIETDPNAAEEEERSAPLDADNLAEGLDSTENATLAQRIIELVDLDIESRKEWFEKYKRGLETIALLGDGDKPAIDGGATVVHPLITEAVVQFQARAMAEVFPASGPVKGMVIGDQTQDLIEQSERVAAHMNWQMLEEDEGYVDDVDQMLMHLPLIGSCFKKVIWDEVDRLVASRYYTAERVIVPYRATSLRSASRVTHWFELDRHEMEDLQASGFYLSADKVALQKPSEPSEETVGQQADEASPSTDEEEDGVYNIYETAIRWKLPGTDTAEWYLITVSRDDVKTLSIRRFWTERNGRRVRRNRFVHYKYLPGLGFYGYGLIHLMGGINKATTDTLRAIMDAAAASTWQGGFATKEAKALGKEIRIERGKWKLVDMTLEDLKNAFYTPPYRDPSPVLPTIFEILVTTGQRFGSTTEAMVGEGKENVPVGTTIARIEQASKVYSGIHARIHRAARAEFRMRAELNHEHLEEALEFELSGANLVIYPEDYDARVDVVPVSDPNIVSTPQRIALAQAQLELARQNPAHFDVLEAERRYLQALQAPDIDKVLIGPDQIPMLDPVSEGARAMTGQAIKAFPEQDHAAHLAVHMGQMQMLVGSPVEQIAVPALQAHIAQHMAQQYRVQMSAQLGVQIPDPSAIKPGEQSPMPPEVQDAIGLAAAQLMAQQQQQQAEQPPDPESALKMAQADKTKAEAEEVRQRVGAAAMQAQAGEAAAAQMIQPLLEQLAAAQQQLEQNAKRDQAVEQALMNLMAEVQDLRQSAAEKEETAKQEQDEQRAEEGRRAEIEKVRGESSKQVETLQKKIDALEQTIKDMVKEAKVREEERAKAEKEREKREGAEKPESAPPAPNITIGPIVIEPAKGGAKTIEIKKTADGKFVGTSKDADGGGPAGG